MSKPFDAASKYLFETDPASWLTLIGVNSIWPVSVLDADLSTVTSEADKVIKIDAPNPWLVHVEIQASYDSNLARRLLRYNVLLESKYDLPVHSVAVLLRREANVPNLQGEYERRPPTTFGLVRFEYQVIRLWQQPVGPILDAGLGTLPLAPVCNVTIHELPGVLSRIAVRYRDEVSEEECSNLWVATRTLMGLKYTTSQITELIRGVRAMIMGIRGIEASSFYQEILAEGKAEGKAEGRLEETRKLLLRLGRIRFGAPSEDQVVSIGAIADLGLGELLAERLLKAESWTDLLQGS